MHYGPVGILIVIGGDRAAQDLTSWYLNCQILSNCSPEMFVCYARDRAQVDVAIAEIRQDRLTLSLIIDVEDPLNERGLAVVPSDFVQRCSLRKEGGQLRKVSV